jgi:hypothetical protein
MQLSSTAPQLEEASADKGEPYYYKQGTWNDQEKSNGYRRRESLSEIVG